jgi:Flp pilus assembly protein TadD
MNVTGKKIGLQMAAAMAIAAALMVGCQSAALTSAKIYVQQEDWSQAAVQLQSAVEETSDDAEAWMLLAVARANLGEFEQAGRAFARSVDDPTHQEEARSLRRGFWAESFNRGVDALRMENFAAAARAFEAAIALDSSNVDALRNVGYVYHQLKRPAEAIKAYRRVLETDPGDEDTAVRLGYLYYNEEDFENAAELLAGPGRDSDDTQLLSALAASYESLGRSADALEVLEVAHKKGAANAEMLMEQGRIYWSQERFDLAEGVYREAVTLAPDDADVHHNHAMSLLELKRDNEARPVLERVVELNAEMGDAWYWLGVVHARENRVRESEAAFERATQLGVE